METELSEQIRVYFDATTGPTVLPLPADPDDVATAAWSDLPLVQIDDRGTVVGPPSAPRPSRRRGWFLAAAAAAAVLVLVAVGLVVADRDGDREPARADNTAAVSTPTLDVAAQPEAIARQFLDAYGGGRLDEAASYFADDADVSGLTGPWGTWDDLVEHPGWLTAVRYEQALTECDERTDSPSRSEIRCAFEFGLLRSDTMGLDRYSGSSFDVVVADEQVVVASVVWNFDEFALDVWRPFADWVASNFPDDVALMYTDETRTVADISQIGLWRDHTEDYAQRRRDLARYQPVRETMTVDGVSLSLELPGPGWETYEGFSVSASTHGPQGAEAIMYWTAFPKGEKASLCPELVLPLPESIDDIAAAFTSFPGVEVVSDVAETTIDGRPARHVSFEVIEDAGCDPGYFYLWKAKTDGALWVSYEIGDTIDLWIIDVDGTVVVMGAEVHPDGGSAAPDVEQIVASIRFD